MKTMTQLVWRLKKQRGRDRHLEITPTAPPFVNLTLQSICSSSQPSSRITAFKENGLALIHPEGCLTRGSLQSPHSLKEGDQGSHIENHSLEHTTKRVESYRK